MLTTRWGAPKWTNAYVNRRQLCPPAVSGPWLATPFDDAYSAGGPRIDARDRHGEEHHDTQRHDKRGHSGAGSLREECGLESGVDALGKRRLPACRCAGRRHRQSLVRQR